MSEVKLELEVCGGCNEKIGVKDLSSILKDLKPYKREEIQWASTEETMHASIK
ncbi:MAG: hypothetical protein ACLU1X_00025 [Peptoniphilus grossensis]